MPHVIPRLPFLLCAAGLLLMRPAPAEGVGAVPPEPMELHIKVHREGKTEIPLRIYGKANEPLKYFIRIPPEHGKLSEPRATEREVSVVVYEPPPDLSITTDKFYYTVQSSQGVSGAVQVLLTIVDDPPKLAISDSLDFGKIRAGASNHRMLEISNHGGLIATGQVIVDSPWKIDGKSEYRMAAGEIAVFKIIFQPVAGGKYEGVARYTSDHEHSTTLRGVAETAIAVDPAEWVLEQIPGDPERSGTFELSNQLDQPRTLHLKTDPRLKVPAEITLAPRGKARVTVAAASGDARAWDAEIRLSSEDFSIAVPVRVPALGPVVRLITPAIAFGRLAMGKDGESSFELQNIGGVPGTVNWEIAPPFHVPGNSATLQPGDRKSFPLTIETKTAGRYRTWLQFTVGAQTFDLPVQAEVVAPQQRPSAAAPPAAGAGSPTEPAHGAFDTKPPASDPRGKLPQSLAADWYSFLPLKGVHVHDITPTSAIVEWPGSLSKATRFRVEMIQLSIERDHLVHSTWLFDNEDPIEARGPNYALILRSLWPEQPYTVRILPLDASGQAGDRLFTVRFLTPPKPPLLARFSGLNLIHVLLVLLTALLAWHFRKWWQARKSFRT